MIPTHKITLSTHTHTKTYYLIKNPNKYDKEKCRIAFKTLFNIKKSDKITMICEKCKLKKLDL